MDLYTTRLVVGDRQVADIGEAFGLSLHDMRRPVVSRSEGRMLIDASPTGRWDRLVSLLGVDIFAQARRELTQEAQRLARASELQQTDTLLVEMRRFPELTHAADAADRTMFRRSDLTAALLAAAAGEGVAAASPAAAVAGLEALAPPARPPLPPSPSAAATATVTQAREAVAALQEPPAVGSDRARQALLRDGLRVVKDGDPTCPFCGEPMLNADRLTAIRAQLDSLGNAAEAERTRQTQLGDVRAAASGLADWLPADTYRDQCSAAGATAEAVSAVLVKLDGVRTLADTARNRLTSLAECSASSDWPECRATAEGALTDMSTAVDGLQRVEREMMESPPQDNDRDQVADQRRVALRRACENEELLARGGGIRTVRARVDGLCQELKRTERRLFATASIWSLTELFSSTSG